MQEAPNRKEGVVGAEESRTRRRTGFDSARSDPQSRRPTRMNLLGSYVQDAQFVNERPSELHKSLIELDREYGEEWRRLVLHTTSPKIAVLRSRKDDVGFHEIGGHDPRPIRL